MHKLLLLATFGIFFAISATAQDFGWAVNMGGPNLESALSTAVDEFGNIYMTGYFNATADFDPGPEVANLTTIGSADAFVVKMSPEGRLLWARQIGGDQADQGNEIRIDARGYVIVTGIFSDTVDFDPGPGQHNLTAAGDYDAFILKLDPDGNFYWVNQIGSTEYDTSSGLAVDAQGNIFVCGSYRGTVDFDPGSPVLELSSAGESDVYILKMDWKGTLIWARSIGGTKVETADGLAISSDGFVYTMGVFRSTADMDPGAGTANLNTIGNYANLFVQKMDGAGNYVWAKQVGGSYFQFGSDIEVNAAGNLFVTGTFAETADFDPGPGDASLTAVGYDTFIWSLDASGNFQWVRHIKGNGNLTDSGESLSVDAQGDIYVCGEFLLTADFNPGPAVFNLTSAGSEDGFIMKIDAAGTLLWARKMGGTGQDQARSVQVDPFGNIYTVGSFYNTVDFNPLLAVNNLVSNGTGDIFVQKLTQNRNFSGRVVNDLNFNGLADAGEPGLAQILLAVPSDEIYATTDSLGYYRIYSDIVDDSLFVVKHRPYWIVTPEFAIPDTMETPMNFTVGIPNFKDLCLVAVNVTRFRPGFNTEVILQVANVGTLPVDSARLDLLVVGQATPAPLEYVSSTPEAFLVSEDHYSWQIGPLAPDATVSIRLILRTPAGTPISTPLTFSSSVGPEDDAYIENNFSRFTTNVVGSFDPNDKQVSPVSLLPAQLDTSTLLYFIRFQNTGNFPAEFVTIRDTMPEELNLATLQILGGSHPFTWRVYNERVLEFRFDPIVLPDSLSDEPGSHGFVAFQAKPRTDLAPGDSIVNSAGIYFDYNAPVITPPAVFRVATLPVGIYHPAVASLDFSLMPNPGTKGRGVMLDLPENLKNDTRIEVYDANGRMQYTLHCPAGRQRCLLPDLSAGVYMVQVTSGTSRGAKVLVIH